MEAVVDIGEPWLIIYGNTVDTIRPETHRQTDRQLSAYRDEEWYGWEGVFEEGERGGGECLSRGI